MKTIETKPSVFARLMRTILYKIGTSGISFAVGIFTAHLLTVAERGTYNSVGITLILLNSFFSGYANFFNYGLNRLKLDRQKLANNASQHIMLVTTGIMGLLVIAIFFVFQHPKWIQIIFILGAMPFTIIFSYASRLLQALNKIDLLNRLNLIQPISFLVFCVGLLIVHILKPYFLASYLLTATLSAYLLSYFIAALCAGFVTRRVAYISVRPKRNKSINALMLPYGYRVGVQNVLTNLNYRGDFYMVEWFTDPTQTGWYGNAVSISELLWQVSQSLSLIVYSSIAREERERSIELTERTFRFSLWFLIFGGVIMYFCSPLIPILYSHKFAPSITPFKILLIGTASYGATGVLTQFFTDQLGKVKYPMYWQGACVIMNVLTCLVLIPRFGMNGGAIASSIAYIVALITSIIYYMAHTKRSFWVLILFNSADLRIFQRLLARG